MTRCEGEYISDNYFKLLKIEPIFRFELKLDTEKSRNVIPD